MPGTWLNVGQTLPDGGFILTPSYEEFPLVVLSTTPLMEALAEAPSGKDEGA